MTADVLCIGECMAELSGSAGGGMRLGFGGDTLNTCVYLARLLGPGRVGYVTRIGDDPYSRRMAAAWAAEGVDMALVEPAAGRTIGLYAIETDRAGERSFTYWRSEAPARGLFTEGAVAAREAALASAACVYFSGITLAILPEAGRVRLLAAAERARAAGALVAVDPNYRPRLWSEREAALWLERAYRAATVVLTSAEEEERLFGAGDPFERIAALGPEVVVAKAGAAGAEVWAEGARRGVPGLVAEAVVDTTGAGDSFVAGFLAAYLRDRDAHAAAALGCALGARVVAYPGAVVPAAAMAGLSVR